MYILVVVLPLLSSLILLGLGRKIGKEGSKIITQITYGISWILSILIYNEIKNTGIEIKIQSKLNWIEIYNWKVNWELWFDKYGVTMLLLILTVSTIVQMYSYWYLSEDPHLIRFIGYIQIFTISMIILVISNNFMILFIGWEGMGLMSYMLINYWSTSIESNKSGMKAILYNKIGDLSIMLGFIIAKIEENIENINILNIYNVNTLIQDINFEINNKSKLIFLFIIAAIAKSALFIFHGWLVSAMQGPTPVSALLHAATMVTAGIYLMLRINELNMVKNAILLILIVGSITVILASISSLFLLDIKKIIALSTCSQIGYMFVAIGLQSYSNSIFHLLTHGFFKALLFLCSGIIIHSLFNEQDYRKFGGFIYKLPLTYIYMLIGSLSLLSFPYLSGFYSKESILVQSLFSYPFVYISCYIGALITSLYSFRLIYFIFLSKPRCSEFRFNQSIEAPKSIFYYLFILIFGSIFIGYLLKDYYIGPGIANTNNNETEFFLYENKLLLLFPWIVILMSILSIIFKDLNYKILKKNFIISWLSPLANRRYYIESLINILLVKNINPISKFFFSLLDQGYLESMGPVGIYRNMYKLTKEKSENMSFILTTWTILSVLILYLLFPLN